MNDSSAEQAAFAAALACANPAERAACLDAHCGGDAALRRRVEALLRAATQAGDFLEVPPPGLAAVEAEFCEQAGDRIGRYKLLEKIGEGGCGIVFMAEQEEPVRRRVALKIIKPGMDSRAVIARFEAERQALAMMDHANIARVFDGGATPAGRPYFVMELVRGIPVTAFCDEAALPTAERLRLFVQVCQAVQHAHQKGIIHRDLKPSNILVTVNDGVPVPKVIDFGIAKATGARLTDKSLFTQFHAFIGTPAYTSPEQAEMSSVDIDTRSDIYSLGVLLYELLTSRTPFDGEELLRAGLDEMRRVIRTQEPPRPSSRITALSAADSTALSAKRRATLPALSSDLRGDLDWIAMKCLEKDRARRYETASSLAADVQRHLEHEPITARPPSPLYRFRKMVRRNKGTFAALTAIVLTLCAGTIVSVWQAMRARRGEQRANEMLAELRATAPAYLGQSRELVRQGKFAEAHEKLDQALKLTPADPVCLLAEADLLECQLRFGEAAERYRAVCRLDPSHTRARTHLALCEQLIRPPGSPPTQQWHDTLSHLYATMGLELTRHDTEMAEIAGLVLENIQQQFRTPEGRAGQPFLEHLKIGRDGGLLGLDLRKTPLVDLSPLRGLPLGYVHLTGCRVADLGPLSESPVMTLNISSTLVADISPLREMTALRNMTAHDGKFSDLSPLQDIPMEWMDISGSAVTDISPLRGKPLRVLRLGYTKVSDLSPLAGLPLRELECDAIPALNLSPLSQCPQLIYLKLSRTGVQSLEVIRDLKLRYLYFDHTQASDLTPLAGMPLNGVGFYNTQVTDAAPLLKCPALAHIGLSKSVKNAEVLRALPNLRRISFRAGADGLPAQTAAEFWKEMDAAK